MRPTGRPWCPDRTITRVDTLRALDQWIPLAHYKKEFPIYKFHYNGRRIINCTSPPVAARCCNLPTPPDASGPGSGLSPTGYTHHTAGKTRTCGPNSCTGHVTSVCSCVPSASSRHSLYWLTRRKGFLRSPYKNTVVQVAPRHRLLFGIFIFTWITQRLHVHGLTPRMAFASNTPAPSGNPRQSVKPRPMRDYALDYRKAIASPPPPTVPSKPSSGPTTRASPSIAFGHRPGDHPRTPPPTRSALSTSPKS